jgi:hypothetical protein
MSRDPVAEQAFSELFRKILTGDPEYFHEGRFTRWGKLERVANEITSSAVGRESARIRRELETWVSAYDGYFDEDDKRHMLVIAETDLRAGFDQVCRSGPSSPCTWTEDSDGTWHTACGEAHVFTTDGPEANRHRFCPYCGKGLEVAPAALAGEPGEVSDLQEHEDFEGEGR